MHLLSRQFDASLLSIITIHVHVLALRIVLLLQHLPLFAAILDHVFDHAYGTRTLLLTALSTVGFQGIRQDALQLVTVRGATALLKQTLVVVVEQAVRLQDLIRIDTIVLGGVLILGSYRGEQGQSNDDEEFHV
uniref:Putative secreted protein n=1 Tax=Anopheles darlingi TaxID=43151 RepID=A0A2M4D715_ANODA